MKFYVLSSYQILKYQKYYIGIKNSTITKYIQVQRYPLFSYNLKKNATNINHFSIDYIFKY